ncbi:28759_t:CDS:2, partial [Racocetra persica]
NRNKIIPREKNNTEAIKNLDNAGHKCEIPPDQDGKFTPVADILYYINKRSSGFITQEFFLQIACKKGISMHLRKITNHSLRRTAIQILTELNVATDRIMPFSGHHTLNGVMSYQTFIPQIMHNMVSLIIPDRNSSEFNNNDKKEDHNKEYSGNQKESHDKDYGNKKEIHDDGNKNEDANKKKRIPLAPLPSNVESNSHNSRKKRK